MKIYHVTWVTHSSRISERMKKYGADKNLIPISLTEEEEIEITEYILQIVIEDRLKIIAYNICKDHVHLIVACEEENLDNIIQKMKAVSSRKFNINHELTISGSEQGSMLLCSETKIVKRRGKSQNHLWAQKFNHYQITNEEQLFNTYEYVKNNRLKHNLANSKELEKIIQKMLTPYEKIY